MSVRTYRSMLFVPGQRQGWAQKALAADPDAIILDLEDAVPEAEKDAARATVASAIDAATEQRREAGDDAAGSATDVWVRPNDWESRRAGLDIEATVRPGLTGFVLPKLHTAQDVLRFDTLVAHCELRNGVPEGSIALIATLETAQGMGNCEQIASASPRVISLVGLSARDADSARALGYEFSEQGLETLYVRSRILLASRAASHQFALCGLWQDIRDLEGLVRFSRHQRRLGYDGQLLIHPAHVGPVHEVYTPSPEKIEFYRGMLDAFLAAEGSGAGSVDYEGQHIDRAHYETARAIVAAAGQTRGSPGSHAAGSGSSAASTRSV
ncbi:MAG: HpcH/HpaI aldolase/citrate lyase family protein [Solirubrobacteraceae bacterium]